MGLGDTDVLELWSSKGVLIEDVPSLVDHPREEEEQKKNNNKKKIKRDQEIINQERIFALVILWSLYLFMRNPILILKVVRNGFHREVPYQIYCVFYHSSQYPKIKVHI